jgi:hypothetical protein
MHEVFELFPPDAWRGGGDGREGYWFDTRYLIEEAGHRRGYAQIKALKRRGLIETRALAPWQWEGENCIADWHQNEWFCRLTDAGVTYRNRLAGRQWAMDEQL